jgi:hypothetical protein
MDDTDNLIRPSWGSMIAADYTSNALTEQAHTLKRAIQKKLGHRALTSCYVAMMKL